MPAAAAGRETGKALPRGLLYGLYDRGIKGECVVTDEDGVLEIKNIATKPAYQRQGYGRAMIECLVRTHAGRYSILQAGTGDSPLTVPFYEKCGFCIFSPHKIFSGALREADC